MAGGKATGRNPHITAGRFRRVEFGNSIVFAHTQYDFSSLKVGFEVFRFEADQTVEHWDNIQEIEGPNPSGHSMLDGSTTVVDLDRTISNRDCVRAFVDEVLISGKLDRLQHYIDGSCYTEHNPGIGDGLAPLQEALSKRSANGNNVIQYQKNHRLLAEGNFVLSVNEGALNGVHTSFYDLFRLSEGKIVEHWDTREAVPPRIDWKNDNGKF